ncbi:TetR/AcrR family transcriptional regulator [Nocardia huaxiensis]|uniref:TetR/AcrR family transcriptional regulator n=1 Tax=Nocardia huaxiensis TaxID=2755382 RepID=A0A7D6VBD0_9NOCA|nr:TetR/AcrR family transcriptional regulator [Nocardia huaxiensis]QLY28115.1 TetR/AcrR family transcriptional regulator [Nocardia huaxiensis]
MKPTVRPTSEEIDHALIDVAAFVFAQHGFAQGTVQAIADGAGYSKAAVLKRFGSKERIQDAVVSRAEEHAARVAAAGAGLAVGVERDAALLGALVELIEEWPGTGALIVGAFWLTREPEIMQRLSGAQRTLMEAFDPDVWTDEGRHVRVVSAIGAVTVTMMANREARWTERTDVVIAAGLGALGHRGDGDVGTGD